MSLAGQGVRVLGKTVQPWGLLRRRADNAALEKEVKRLQSLLESNESTKAIAQDLLVKTAAAAEEPRVEADVQGQRVQDLQARQPGCSERAGRRARSRVNYLASKADVYPQYDGSWSFSIAGAGQEPGGWSL